MLLLLSIVGLPHRRYGQQRDMLELLQRVSEHFAAAVFSLEHTRSIDALRMVVPWAIVAIADCVMRQTATDAPSIACTHLNRFTLGTAALAMQAATTPCFTPEMNVARTKVLDYFAAQKALKPLMTWEKGQQVDAGLAQYMRLVSHDVAFPNDDSDLRSMLPKWNALLGKNYPEFLCCEWSSAQRPPLPLPHTCSNDPVADRDIAFFAKLAVCPDMSVLPKRRAKLFSQKEAELNWSIAEEVTAQHNMRTCALARWSVALMHAPSCGMRGQVVPRSDPPIALLVPRVTCLESGTQLKASHGLLPPGRNPPTHRFASGGTASEHTKETVRTFTAATRLPAWSATRERGVGTFGAAAVAGGH
jgi:hypothetical protein